MALKRVENNFKPFELVFKKITYGPIGKKPPKMIWLEGEKSKELFALKRSIDNALAQAVNFKPETRAISPHITLARLKMMEFRVMEQEEVPEINENIEISLIVESIEIMESQLKRAGPVYSVIESFPFAD